MKNKVVIVNCKEIAFAGTICSGPETEDGIILKPSEKSDILMWFPINEIEKIVFPDASAVEGENLNNIFSILETFNSCYELED